MSDILEKSIKELEMSIRAYNALKKDNVLTIGKLIENSYRYLLRTPGIGKKTADDIKNALAQKGLILKKE